MESVAHSEKTEDKEVKFFLIMCHRRYCCFICQSVRKTLRMCKNFADTELFKVFVEHSFKISETSRNSNTRIFFGSRFCVMHYEFYENRAWCLANISSNLFSEFTRVFREKFSYRNFLDSTLKEKLLLMETLSNDIKQKQDFLTKFDGCYPIHASSLRFEL